MYKFCFSENLSLAFNLGTPSLSEAENERLYGFYQGQQVRGHNLKVFVFWENPSSQAECRNTTKTLLKVWDHSFLNQRQEFAGRPVTLENICLAAARLFEDREFFSEVKVRQGAWTARRRKGAPGSQVEMERSLRFQSLLETETGFRPLDFVMNLCWRGDVDSKTGLIAPWSELKNSLPQLESSEDALTTAGFLEKTAAQFFARDTKGLSSVEFFDPKDKVGYRFERGRF